MLSPPDRRGDAAAGEAGHGSNLPSSPALDLNSFPDPEANSGARRRPRVEVINVDDSDADSSAADRSNRRKYSYEEKGKAKIVVDDVGEFGSRGGGVEGMMGFDLLGRGLDWSGRDVNHGFVDNSAVDKDWLSIRLPDFNQDMDGFGLQDAAGLSMGDVGIYQQENGGHLGYNPLDMQEFPGTWEHLMYNPITAQEVAGGLMDDMVYEPGIGENLVFNPRGKQEVAERMMKDMAYLQEIGEDFVYNPMGEQEVAGRSMFDMVYRQGDGKQLMNDPVVPQSVNSMVYQRQDEAQVNQEQVVYDLQELERRLMDDTVYLEEVNPIGADEAEERMVDWAQNWDPVAYRRNEDRLRAMESAARFARPQNWENHEENGVGTSPLNAEMDLLKLPGPFSACLKSIMERERLRKMGSSELVIHWRPLKGRPLRRRLPPPLKDLCLQVLARNADEVESLEGIPDFLKKKFIRLACSYRKMNVHILGIYLSRSPMEICLSDCSWAREDLFEAALKGCNFEHLKVLQLDLCGRCLPDYVLHATLTRKPNSLPSLTTVSLRAAYRLTDDGLTALASSAPLLSSVNLGQCSLLTSTGITELAIKLNSTLRKLYIDDCLKVDVMVILPTLKKLKNLELLSVARVESVSDRFVCELVSSCGPNLRELAFSNCQKLTGTSLVAIGESCSQLCALDIQDLCHLNDYALGHLANGCGLIQRLKLGINSFSDEAVAAFLEVAGGSLTDFSLNSVKQVAEHTALAISRRCFSSLHSLDLSFCRKMTDEALGLIVDSCSNLRILKLFGCTQITDVFLDGHSNPIVKIIGLKGSILDQIDMPDFC